MKFLLLVTLLLAEGSPFWINNSDCPIEIWEYEGNGFLMFENKGAKPLIEVYVACIEYDKKGNITVGDTVYQKKVSISASGGFFALDIAIADELKSKCKNTESRIGVTRIKFADGSLWELDSLKK